MPGTRDGGRETAHGDAKPAAAEAPYYAGDAAGWRGAWDMEIAA